MMLTEFCLLRRVLAQIVQENLLAVNLSYLVPDLAQVNRAWMSRHRSRWRLCLTT